MADFIQAVAFAVSENLIYAALLPCFCVLLEIIIEIDVVYAIDNREHISAAPEVVNLLESAEALYLRDFNEFIFPGSCVNRYRRGCIITHSVGPNAHFPGPFPIESAKICFQTLCVVPCRSVKGELRVRHKVHGVTNHDIKEIYVICCLERGEEYKILIYERFSNGIPARLLLYASRRIKRIAETIIVPVNIVPDGEVYWRWRFDGNGDARHLHKSAVV